MDVTTSVAIEAAVKHVVEKIKRGKRPTAEDILILQLGSISEDVRVMRIEMTEREKALREEIIQMRREVHARLDAIDAKFDAKIEELRKEMNARFDALHAEINRRFDELHRLLITALAQKRES